MGVVKDKTAVWAVDAAKVAGKGALGTPQSPPGPCSRYEMTQDDQTPNHSPLAQSVTRDGKTVRIDIYEDGEGGWLLEVVDEYWNSTVWDPSFASDREALAEALKTIDEDGIESLIGAPPGTLSH